MADWLWWMVRCFVPLPVTHHEQKCKTFDDARALPLCHFRQQQHTRTAHTTNANFICWFFCLSFFGTSDFWVDSAPTSKSPSLAVAVPFQFGILLLTSAYPMHMRTANDKLEWQSDKINKSKLDENQTQRARVNTKQKRMGKNRGKIRNISKWNTETNSINVTQCGKIIFFLSRLAFESDCVCARLRGTCSRFSNFYFLSLILPAARQQSMDVRSALPKINNELNELEPASQRKSRDSRKCCRRRAGFGIFLCHHYCCW